MGTTSRCNSGASCPPSTARSTSKRYAVLCTLLDYSRDVAVLLLDVDVEDFDDVCTLIAAAVTTDTHSAKEANVLVRTLKLRRKYGQ